MDTELFFDILRIVLLVIQVIGAVITVTIFLLTRKVSAKTLLNNLLQWYEKSMEDGKITPEELVDCMKMIRNLSEMSDKDKSSTETKEDKK